MCALTVVIATLQVLNCWAVWYILYTNGGIGYGEYYRIGFIIETFWWIAGKYYL